MSGHSKWSQIKHQKGITDQKRGQVFSKLLSAISIAARTNPNPEFNPKLRAAVQKAKDANVPNENIERALKRASDTSQDLEELVLEGYGPGGSAILIEAVTDNRNRTVSETKSILTKNSGKWAEPGSVLWAFEKVLKEGQSAWEAKFPQALTEGDLEKLKKLITVLEENSDILNVYTNILNN